MKRALLAIISAALWISLSEFIRNQLLFQSYWIEHYQSLGLIFPTSPINGLIWGIWSLVFAIIIYVLAQRYSFKETTGLSWVIGFVLMWLVIGNLRVLPYKMLYIAIPFSLIEVIVATLIIFKISIPKSKQGKK